MSQPSSATPVPSPARRRWPRRLFYAAAAALVVYVLFGFFGVPLLARHVIVPRLSDRIDGSMTLTRARFNPFTLALSLEGLEVVDGEGGERVGAFDRFDANFQLFASVFRSGWHFRAVRVTRPYGLAKLWPDGRVNILRMIWPKGFPEPTDERAPIEAIPRVVVEDCSVVDGHFVVRDETLETPFEKILTGVTVDLGRLDTRSDHENTHAIVLTTAAGAHLSWEGSAFIDPLSSSGRLAVTGIELPSFQPYIAWFVDGDVKSGRLSAELSYDFAPVRVPRRARVTLHTGRVEGLELERHGASVLAVETAALANARIDADARHVGIERMSAQGVDVQAERTEEGELPLLTLVRRATGDPDGAGPAEDGTVVDPQTIEFPILQLLAAIQKLVLDARETWTLDIDHIEASDYDMTFTDRAARGPVVLDLGGLRIEAGPMKAADDYRLPFVLETGVGDAGTATIDGAIHTTDRRIVADVTAEGIDVTVAAPYLPRELPEPLPAADLTSGVLMLDGRIDGRVEGKRVDAAWDGRLALTGLGVTRSEGDGALVSVGRVEIDGAAGGRGERTDFETLTFDGTVTVRDVALAVPEILETNATLDHITLAALTIDHGARRLDLERLLVGAPVIDVTLPLMPGAEPPALPAWSLDLDYVLRAGEVRVSGGTVRVHDVSGDPTRDVALTSLEVLVGGVTTGDDTPIPVTVTSNLAGSGRVEITGTVTPRPEAIAADIAIGLQGLALPPFDAIANPRVGRHIESGRLTMRFPVTLQEGIVDGELDFDFSGLQLGEKVESAYAPNAPIKLGLDLLRDGDDHIKGTLPITGELSDPEFSLSGVVWDAFMNMLVGAATSPFNLLGSIFGGEDGPDLSRVGFEPGRADLTPETVATLDVLARALTERPALTLAARGGLRPEVDEPALRRIMLREEMLAVARRGNSLITALSAEAYAARIEYAYAKEILGDANRVGTAEIPAHEEMEAALLDRRRASNERLTALTEARLEAVRSVLVDENGIEGSRIATEAGEIDEAGGDSAPEVRFDLR